MNHHPASSYQNSYQHHDLTTGTNFQNGAAALASSAHIGVAQASVPNAFVFGQRNIDDFYHNHNQHAPLVYQAMDASVISPNQLAWPHQQQQRYVLPPLVPPTTPYLNTSPFGMGAYPTGVNTVEQLPAMKLQQGHSQAQWRHQPLFSVFNSPPQQPMPDSYFPVTSSQSPSPAVPNSGNPLAGLRALSDQYTRHETHRGSKSPKCLMSSLATNAENPQKRPGIDSTKPTTPNVASPSANCRHPGINSPLQSNSFIPPSPGLKSSCQTARSSPMSTSTANSGHVGGSCLVSSPATSRGHSVSSAGSMDAHVDPGAVTAPPGSCGGGMTDGVHAVMSASFSAPIAHFLQQGQSYDDALTHPSTMASFYTAQGVVDPAAALMDPNTTALFGPQVVGSDPSLHSTVDDALSLLSRDVNLGDLSDINCANMMVGHNFWDDLGDAVLDDPLLSSHGPAVCTSSTSVDLINSNNLTSIATGTGVLLHSVLEFGTLPSNGANENGQPITSGANAYRFQDGVAKSVSSDDLNNAVPASASATIANPVHSIQGDVKVATPKLREKMKRKAQGENELAEIDRAFARHLSMVAEKNQVHLSSTQPAEKPAGKVEALPLDALTAEACLQNRLKATPSNWHAGSRTDARSPVQFTHSPPEIDAELERVKKNVRKIVFAKRPPREGNAGQKTDSTKRSSTTTPDAATSSTCNAARKGVKQPNKVPIYKQTSTADSVSDQRRNSGCGGNADDDSPYNFTDFDDDKAGAANRNETSAQSGEDSSGTPATDSKQKGLDAEVTKKLLQISTLHPELKLSSLDGEKDKNFKDMGMRHVLPKKRQWQMIAADAFATKGQQLGIQLAEGKIGLKKIPKSSSSMFVKTEIITDDMTTAMPSSGRVNNFAHGTNSRTDTADASPPSNGKDKILLPKLIIRIPRKCLEQQATSSCSPPTGDSPGADNPQDKEDRHRRHSHKKKKREKRIKRESEQEEDGLVSENAGDLRKHKKHKSRNVGEHDHARTRGTDADAAGDVRYRQSISEQDVNDDTTAAANAGEFHKEARQKELAVSSNGLEFDHLPFKLRKKLQRMPSALAMESAGQAVTKGSVCTDSVSTSSATISRCRADVHDQADENQELTSLRLRFLAGPVFQKGAFVVCKDDIGKQECPLWKVDSQNLLQKFSPCDRQGRIVYVSSSTFAGWCLQNQDLYVPVHVRYVMQSRSEAVVELESSLEETFPAVSTELTEERQRNGASSAARSSGPTSVDPADGSCELLEHPQTEALVVYVNILLFHALLGNCLQRNNNASNGDWVSRIKEVDLLNADKCRALLSLVNWQRLFKESLEWYSHCTVSEDESFGLQCQACGKGAACNVLQLFANEGYDFETLEARPPQTTASGSPLPSQDFHLCSSCATVAVRYHTLFHMRYHLFRKCEDALELVRDGNPMLAVGAVVDVCMQNKKWLSTTLNEYLQLWSTLR